MGDGSPPCHLGVKQRERTPTSAGPNHIFLMKTREAVLPHRPSNIMEQGKTSKKVRDPTYQHADPSWQGIDPTTNMTAAPPTSHIGVRHGWRMDE